MPEQSKKYYSAMKSKILERFSYLLDIMKIELLEYFESDLLNRMLFEFKELYNDSLSEIPYIGGKKNLFTRNVAYSSPSIIFWKVLKAHNFPIEKFAPIYLKALKINVEQEYKGIKGLLKRMLQKILIRKTFLRFMWKNQAKITDEYPKNFIAKPIKEKKGEFDFGYIMTQCPIVEFGKSQNAQEILPYLCIYDWYRAYYSGSGLIRSKTIAEGYKYCDYRFKPGESPKNLQDTQIPDGLKPGRDCQMKR